MRSDDLLGQIRLPVLEVIDLDGMMMPLEELQRFLIRYKHTLERMHLQNLLISIPASKETSLCRLMG